MKIGMNALAFGLAVAAIVAFLVTYFSHRRPIPRPYDLNSVGLALLSAAWIVQLVWVSGPVLSTH